LKIHDAFSQIAFSLDRFNFFLTFARERLIFGSIQSEIAPSDWIDPRKEIAMHPVKFLFDEINRDYWGIPEKGKREREHREVPVRPRFHPLQRLEALPR
jgi:hypothetical protein